MVRPISYIFALALVSCGIEQDFRKEMAKSSQRCEQKISEKIMQIEENHKDHCISKEELLRMLKTLQNERNVEVEIPEELDVEFTPPEDPPFPDGF